MKKLSWLIFIIVALLLGVLVMKTFQHLKKTDQPTAVKRGAPVPVESVPVKLVSMDEVIGASGATEQFTTLTLTAKIEARITELAVAVGSTVKKGDMLAKWDDRIAQASVNSSRARVESCKIKVRTDTRAYERYKNLLDKGMGSAADMEQSEAALAASHQALAAAELAYIRAQVDFE